MSEAEALNFIMMACSNAIASFALYITFTTGYLTVAYFVGAALSRFQALCASGLFVIAAGSIGLSCIVQCNAFESAIATYPTLLNTLPLWTTFSWQLAMSIVIGIGILMSLYFMYSVRVEEGVSHEAKHT